MTVEQAEPAPSSWARRGLYAALRAVIVLLVAVLVYPAVVPYTHTVRRRLAELVPQKTGLAPFDKAKPQAGEQADGATGLAAVTAAAKKSPGRTGIYSIEWSPAATSGAGVIAFLLPTPAAARTTLKQVTDQQLAAGSYSSDHLARVSTFTVAAVPGSAGSLYRPTAKAGGPPGLAVTAFRTGRVVAIGEVADTDSTAVQSEAGKLSAVEAARLRRVEPGFSLQETVNPVVPTVLWGVGTVLLALLSALVPLERHRRALNRQRAYEAEMANKVVVGNQLIAKHRR